MSHIFPIMPIVAVWGGRRLFPGDDSRRGRWRAGWGRAALTGSCWLLLSLSLLQCSRPLQVGQEAPEFTLPDLDGKAVALQSFKGRVLLLHFWATWCPPCIEELPVLSRFGKKLDPSKAVLLSICVDNERPEAIRSFVTSWGLDLPVCIDPGGEVARKYGTFRYPETYVLDPAGVLRKKVIGSGDWNKPDWAQLLHNLYAGTEKSSS